MSVTRKGDRVIVSCGGGTRDPVTQTWAPCAAPATHVIVHEAQIATVADNSAGAESLAIGEPAKDAIQLGVRVAPIALDGCCVTHAEDLLAAYLKTGIAPLEILTLADAGRRGVKVPS